MNTIVETVPADEYAKIAEGRKSFIVMGKFVVPPVAGQRLLIIEEGYTGKEIMTEVNFVGSGPGIYKDHFILQFPSQKAATVDVAIKNDADIVDITGIDLVNHQPTEATAPIL